MESAAPAVMVRTHEDTTGALIQDVLEHKLDLALVFCPPPIEALSSGDDLRAGGRALCGPTTRWRSGRR